MVNSVSSSSVSSVSYTTNAVAFRANVQDLQVREVALPVIENLGDQAKIVGDGAAPGCAPCWVACLANPAWTPFCAAICAAMCVSPLSA